MRYQLFLFILMISFVCGCSHVPFKKTEYASMINVTPEEVLNTHQVLMPRDFKIVNSVVFQYFTRKFVSLGYLSVNADTRSFQLAGMNSMGIKLIEIETKNNEVIVNNVMEEIRKRGDITKVLVDDIYRIYFDLVPLESSLIQSEEKEMIFSQKNGDQRIDYIFAGQGNHLIEKNYYKGRKKRWSVKYYEYEKKDGKIYPQGIIFSNYQYKYKLIINTKEIL